MVMVMMLVPMFATSMILIMVMPRLNANGFLVDVRVTMVVTAAAVLVRVIVIMTVIVIVSMLVLAAGGFARSDKEPWDGRFRRVEGNGRCGRSRRSRA